MAYIPKEWKDLPDETTPIQASDLNHIEQGIKDASSSTDTLTTNVNTLNTNMGDLSTLNTTEKSNLVGAINEVYQNNIYSSDEIVIGKTKDGKNVYRKIIETNSATATQEWKNIIGNIKEIFSFTGNLVVNISEAKILPFTTSGTDSIWFQLNTNTHYFQEAHSNSVYNNKNMKIILEYTKTTD